MIHVQRTAPPERMSVLTDTQHATDAAAAESVASLNLEHSSVQVQDGTLTDYSALLSLSENRLTALPIAAEVRTAP